MDRQDFQKILDTHGRRVFNRAVYAWRREQGEVPKHEDRASWLYAMYGPEDRLPENERCKTSAIWEYDPANYLGMYRNWPTDEKSAVRHMFGQTALDVYEWLVNGAVWWGEWMPFFLSAQLRGISNPCFDSIANNEGEFFVDEESRYCGWYPGWKGWESFALNLTDAELSVLRLLLVKGEKMPRHPEPGSPEAERFMAARDARLAGPDVMKGDQ